MRHHFSLLTLSLFTAFSLPALASATDRPDDIAADETVSISAGDTIHFRDDKDHVIVNNGSIAGKGMLSIQTRDRLENNGTIDVGHYAAGSAGKLVNNQSGTVYVNDGNFGAYLDNSGTVISRTGSLTLTNQLFSARAGSSIRQEDGSRLDSFRFENTQGGIGSPQIDAGAIVEADSVYFDVADQGLILDGALKGDDVTVKGSYIRMGADARIEGRQVTLTQIDQLSGSEPQLGGGTISVTERLVFTNYVNVKDMAISSPEITFTGAANLRGTTSLSNVRTISTASTLSFYDGMHTQDGRIENLILQPVQNAANGPRLQLIGTEGVTIGHLTVGKATNSSGEAISSNLVDKMTSTDPGRSSFAVERATIESGAILALYADDKNDASPTTMHFGSVDIGTDAVLQLGWRNGTYDSIAEKRIDSVALADNAKITAPSQADPAFAEADIGRIVFAGSNAQVESTLIGASTDVIVQEGASGAQLLGAVKTDRLSVRLEMPDASVGTLFSAQSVDSDVDVTLIGGEANNTGRAVEDLERVLAAVDFGASVPTAISVEQEAGGIFDATSADVGADGTLENIQTRLNPTLAGITESASLNAYLWRNEMDDLNKRLGDIRSASGKLSAAWARVYAGKAQFSSQSISNEYNAVQVGVDHEIAPGVRVGAAFSYTDGDNDFDAGSGSSGIYALTGYADWLTEDGRFFDLSLKFGRIESDFDFTTTAGRSKGDYDANAFAVAAEAGWRKAFAQNFFIEPQAALMYGRIESIDYTTSADVKVRNDEVENLVGRAGFMLGIQCPNNRGSAYVRASVLHDWKGEADYEFSQNGISRRLSKDLGDTWYEYGIGADVSVSDALRLYADVEAADGGEVDTDYRVNLGARWLF